MKLTLMLMGGSAFLLIGILGIYYGAGAETMNILEIVNHKIPTEFQRLFFPLVFVGFGVLGALFPFHTWSPDGHASAPTAVSMLHAGVLMKLGGYGCFRIAMYLMLGRLLPRADYNLRGVRSIQRRSSDRPEVHQRLFFGKPLRPGSLRPAYDD